MERLLNFRSTFWNLKLKLGVDLVAASFARNQDAYQLYQLLSELLQRGARTLEILYEA